MSKKNLFSKQKSWQFIEIQGPDAKEYLHRISSANFQQLQPLEFTAATLLQPTGKVVLYFKALYLSENHFLILIPPQVQDQADDDILKVGFQELEKLHFRENFKITQKANTWIYIRVLGFGTLPAFENIYTMNENQWNNSVWSSQCGFDYDIGLVTKKEFESGLIEKLESKNFKQVESLETYRIGSGSPTAPNEINASMIAIEAGLKDAVHENKGCYPGQEVIERIRAIGETPRKLVSIRGKGMTPAFPQTIISDNKEAGIVTSISEDASESAGSDGWVGLALIKKTFLKPTVKAFYIEGQEVEVLQK